MDQGVEEVPDEKDAELGRCRGMEDAEGGGICCDEDRKGCEEGEDGCTINHQGGRSRLSFHVRDLVVWPSRTSLDSSSHVNLAYSKTLRKLGIGRPT